MTTSFTHSHKQTFSGVENSRCVLYVSRKYDTICLNIYFCIPMIPSICTSALRRRKDHASRESQRYCRRGGGGARCRLRDRVCRRVERRGHGSPLAEVWIGILKLSLVLNTSLFCNNVELYNCKSDLFESVKFTKYLLYLLLLQVCTRTAAMRSMVAPIT